MRADDSKRLPLLGVTIDNFSFNVVTEFIDLLIKRKDSFSYITTANPEITLKTIGDEHYRKAVNAADLVTADGIGLIFGHWFTHGHITHRVTGISLTKHIIELCEHKKYSILILNKKQGLSSKKQILEFFSKNYPNIEINVSDIDTNKNIYRQAEESVGKNKTDFILCGLGAPHQELALLHLKEQNKFTGIGIANGASIDFIVGTQKRAPKILQNLGLEWSWRLITRPNRFKRIFNATIVFSLKVIHWKLRSLLKFRHTAMACILNNKKEVIVAHFPEYDQWGLPKGGVEKKEDIITAAKREMNEELGINPDHLKPIKIKPYFHKYLWPWWHKANRGFKGQKVSLVLFEFTGNPKKDITPDGYEVIDYKWTKIPNIIKQVSSNRSDLAKKITKILQEET